MFDEWLNVSSILLHIFPLHARNEHCLNKETYTKSDQYIEFLYKQTKKSKIYNSELTYFPDDVALAYKDDENK